MGQVIQSIIPIYCTGPLSSPENITEHEPTAVKRNPNDQEIVEGGKTGADIPEARDKLGKSGMTKV